MRKYGLSLLMILVTLSLVAQSVNFDLPQFMSPLYESYSTNYVNTMANGRGNTGAAELGGLEQVLINPAGVDIDQGSLLIEMNVKPPTKELDRALGNRYSSPIPFGMFGISQRLTADITGTVMYSMPKSITYDDFSIVMNQGAYLLQRYPSYTLHQFTAGLAYHNGKYHVGLNLHNQIHYLDDMVFIQTFDRVSKLQYSFRPQGGVLFVDSMLSAGGTFMPEQAITIDTPYKRYESVQPLKATAGVKLNVGKRSFLLDFDYEQFSAINTEFKDRLTCKAGYELLKGSSVYRLGFMSVPGIYHGAYVLDQNSTATADTSNIWNSVPHDGTIRKHVQHFITGGYTKKFKVGSISISFMQDVAGYAPVTQINLTMDVLLDTFKPKEIIKP